MVQSADARLLRTLHRERGTWRAALRARHGERIECWDGIRVGDGWAGIVGELLDAIEVIAGGHDSCPEVKVEEIMSKNGMLKIVLRHVPDENEKARADAIVRAGGHAICTCEKCGAMGRVVLRNRRRRVACPAHEDPVVEGREAIAAGDVHDMDDVLREIEEIMRGENGEITD